MVGVWKLKSLQTARVSCRLPIARRAHSVSGCMAPAHAFRPASNAPGAQREWGCRSGRAAGVRSRGGHLGRGPASGRTRAAARTWRAPRPPARRPAGCAGRLRRAPQTPWEERKEFRGPTREPVGGSRRRSQGFRPSLTPRRVRRAPQLIDTGTLGCGFDQTPFSTAHICAQPPVLARPGARKPRLLLSPSRSSALLSHCPRERVGGSAARQLHDTQSAAPSTAHAQQDGRAVPRPSCWKGAETAAEARSSILTAIHRLTTGRMHTGPAHPCPCRACRAARRGRGSRRQSRRRRARRPRARRQGPPPSRPSAAAPSRPRGPTGPRRRARRTARPAGPTWRRARARQLRARARPPPCARARSSQSTSRRGSAPPAAALTARQCA